MSVYANIKPYSGTVWGLVKDIRDMGSHDPDSPRYINIDGVDPAPQVGWYYDISTDSFAETLPPEVDLPRRTVTSVELWMMKFAASERAKVWALCNGETIPGVAISLENRYRTAAFRDLTLAGEPIPLHAAEVETVIDGLETAGLLASGRADEILER
jgi:hypothetical protein